MTDKSETQKTATLSTPTPPAEGWPVGVYASPCNGGHQWRPVMEHGQRHDIVEECRVAAWKESPTGKLGMRIAELEAQLAEVSEERDAFQNGWVAAANFYMAEHIGIDLPRYVRARYAKEYNAAADIKERKTNEGRTDGKRTIMMRLEENPR